MVTDCLRAIQPARVPPFERRFETTMDRPALVDVAKLLVEFADQPGARRRLWLFVLALGHRRLRAGASAIGIGPMQRRVSTSSLSKGRGMTAVTGSGGKAVSGGTCRGDGSTDTCTAGYRTVRTQHRVRNWWCGWLGAGGGSRGPARFGLGSSGLCVLP